MNTDLIFTREQYLDAFRTWMRVMRENNYVDEKIVNDNVFIAFDQWTSAMDLPPSAPVSTFCKIMREAKSSRPAILRDVYGMHHKSNLLARLFHGEALRTVKCPQHNGHWDGNSMLMGCLFGCQGTGWLYRVTDAYRNSSRAIEKYRAAAEKAKLDPRLLVGIAVAADLHLDSPFAAEKDRVDPAKLALVSAMGNWYVAFPSSGFHIPAFYAWRHADDVNTQFYGMINMLLEGEPLSSVPPEIVKQFPSVALLFPQEQYELRVSILDETPPMPRLLMHFSWVAGVTTIESDTAETEFAKKCIADGAADEANQTVPSTSSRFLDVLAERLREKYPMWSMDYAATNPAGARNEAENKSGRES